MGIELFVIHCAVIVETQCLEAEVTAVPGSVRQYIMVICGGVIPAQDYQYLYDAGAVAIFGPGTSVAKAASEILELLLQA